MLESYWPTEDRVNACIKNEAETAGVSVLLAVHQPASLSVRNAGAQSDTPATESDLLDAFLSDNVPSGALLLPIEGPSGAGKSHMIRWLDAQLQRSPKRHQLHIIRIPKSASLRRVVELILEPLANDPRYAQARQDVTRAVEEIDRQAAVVLFRAELENALNRKRAEALAELRAEPTRTELKAVVGHAQNLPRLLSDAALAEHFASVVLDRVVARAVDGRPEDWDEAAGQFQDADLLLPDNIELGKAAEAVKSYYTSQILTVDVERRRAAVDLLNSVVDQAIGNVFRLQQNAGGLSLQDIILAVRQILLEDGKDLVLLVEDFAALAGIQEVLLKVCIQEGEYEGKKVRATMRTAMALTDGYLVSRDTILSRAQRVWAVGRRALSDEQVKAAVVDMAGAYLNAARWGEAKLAKQFGQIAPEQGLTGWLKTWEDDGRNAEEVEALDAFGVSTAGIPLFPFNRPALEQLTERHLRTGSGLVLNPRRVINEILRATLLLRSTFTGGAFPPPGFQRIGANGFLAGWVAQLPRPDLVKRRLSSALAVWGGNPLDERGLAAVAPPVLKAFGLPSLAEVANVAFERRGEIKAKEDVRSEPREIPVPPAPITVSDEDPKIAEWRSKLDGWAGGEWLNQEDARELRNALARLLTEAISWTTLRIPRQEIRGNILSIAKARNNPQVGRIVVVCEQHSDENGALRAGFLGAIRHSALKVGWDYPGGDGDYIAVAALISKLQAKLVPILFDELRDQTNALSHALTMQARIAGLQPPLKPIGWDGVYKGIFSPIDAPIAQEADPAWLELRKQAIGLDDAKNVRATLQDLLLERVGSFQGDTGHKVLAVDIGRIAEGLSAEPANLDVLDPSAPMELRTRLSVLAPALSPAKIWPRIQPTLGQLRQFHRDVGEMLGPDFEKNGFVDVVRGVVAFLSKTATVPQNLKFKFDDLPMRLNEFQASPVKTLVDASAEAVAETGRDQLPKIINVLGALDHAQITRTAIFLRDIEELLTSAEAVVGREERSRAQAKPQVVADEIEAMFESSIRVAAGLEADR